MPTACALLSLPAQRRDAHPPVTAPRHARPLEGGRIGRPPVATRMWPSALIKTR
jgi:hypothetical protein